MRTAAARARQLAKDVQQRRQEAEAAEQRVAQLKAEADTAEETAKRLAAQLEDERQQDEHGQCMVEEISEIKLRRASRTLEKAKEQATVRVQALRAVPKPTHQAPLGSARLARLRSAPLGSARSPVLFPQLTDL